MRNRIQADILFVLLGLKQVSTDYLLKSPTTQWDYQNPPCQLATPEILFSSDGPTINIPSGVNIPQNERVFVGLTRTFDVFENTGCIWDGDLPENTNMYSTQPDPGECYSACKTSHFGIRNGHCYCLTEALKGVKDTYTNCYTQCSFPRYTACGKTGFGYKYLSLYKRVEMNDNGIYDGKYCRTYDQESGSYLWQTCGTKLRGVCQTGARDKVVLNGDRLHWYQYTENCFDQKLYPVTDLRFSVNRDIEVWTGRMRSWVIVKVSEALHKDDFHGHYGYISNVNNKLRLQFTTEQSEYVLCTSDQEATSKTTTAATTTLTMPTTTTTTTTTKSTTTTSATIPPSSISAKTKFPSSTFSSDSTTTGSTTMSFQNQTFKGVEGHKDEHTGSWLIAVYVLIPLVFMMGVAAAVFVIRRNRKRSAGRQTNNKMIYTNGLSASSTPTDRNGTGVNFPTYANASDISTKHDTSALGDTHVDEYTTNTIATTYSNTITRDDGETRQHNYFILEPSYENLGLLKPDQRNVDDGTYDTTNGVTAVDTEVDGNIYNKLNEFTEDTYNHINNGTLNSSTGLTMSGHVSNDDSCYSVSGHNGNDNVYNTANGYIRNENQLHEVEDTYNHI